MVDLGSEGDPMWWRKTALFVYIVVGAFLAAHLVNGVVAHSLSLPFVKDPLAGGVPNGPDAGHDVAQLSQEIESSGLYPVVKEALNQPGGVGAAGAGVGAPVQQLDAARKVRLIGIVMGEETDPRAILEELSTKVQSMYKKNDFVPGVGQIKGIGRDAVLFRQGELEEILELDIRSKSKPAVTAVSFASPGGPVQQLRRTFDRREITQTMNDLPRLLSQARVEPFYTAGNKLEGWKIDALAPQSFYEKLGLRVGDVLQRVNGVEIRDPGMMLSLLQQVKNERTINVDVLRNNQRTTMNYEIR